MKFVLQALMFSVLSAFLAVPAEARVVTKPVVYKDGETVLEGFFAYDDEAHQPMPGVVVVHEWWGNNDYARRRAEQLAGLGYAALAIDMYGRNVLASDPEEAGRLSKPFRENRRLMQSRAIAGLDALRAQPQVDKSRLGAMGYCFGGTVALELARAGEPLKGVVSFHGGLSATERAEPARVKAQVLALNGGADKMVSQQERDNFVAEMKAAGVSFKMVDYPGATHAFTNPKATDIGKRFNLPVEYNETADRKSWEEMKKFFGRLFDEKPVYIP